MVTADLHVSLKPDFTRESIINGTTILNKIKQTDKNEPAPSKTVSLKSNNDFAIVLRVLDYKFVLYFVL